MKSFAVVFVWIPYAVRLLHDFITKYFHRNLENAAAKTLDNLQIYISQILFNSGSAISVFESREIVERYAGLTLAKNLTDGFPSKADVEIFRVALRQNIELGAKCLHRRNRSRIEHHQSLAQADFLKLIRGISISVFDTKKLSYLAVEFAKSLDDAKAQTTLREFFDKTLQNRNNNSVKHLEKELWTAREHKQLSPDKTPFQLRTMTAAEKD